MPKIFISSILILRLLSTLAYAVLYSGLGILLIENLHYPKALAMSIVGMFIALHYILALVGGFVIGNWISYRHSLLLALLLQAAAIVVIFHYDSYIFLACAVFLNGSLLAATPIDMMITERFEAQQVVARESMFLWNYGAMNMGFALGFIILGYFQNLRNYHGLDYIILAFISIEIMVLFLCSKHFLDIHSKYAKRVIQQRGVQVAKLAILLALSTLAIYFMLQHSSLMNTVLIFVIIAVVISILIFNTVKSDHKVNSFIFMLLLGSYFLFCSVYFLIPTGLTLFIRYSTTSELFGFAIPPAWVQSINPILVIVGSSTLGLLFRKHERKFNASMLSKFSLGFISMTIAFALLATSIILANFNIVNIIWVIVAYCFITAAEILMSALGLAITGRYVDRKRQNLMMSVWISTLGTGALLSSKLTSLVAIKNELVMQRNKSFLILFLSIAALMLIIGLGLQLLKPFFEK